MSSSPREEAIARAYEMVASDLKTEVGTRYQIHKALEMMPVLGPNLHRTTDARMLFYPILTAAKGYPSLQVEYSKLNTQMHTYLKDFELHHGPN